MDYIRRLQRDVEKCRANDVKARQLEESNKQMRLRIQVGVVSPYTIFIHTYVPVRTCTYVSVFTQSGGREIYTYMYMYIPKSIYMYIHVHVRT